jgi:hypothetical protein
VAVLQADGRYDLETGENHGDAEDFYIAGKDRMVIIIKWQFCRPMDDTIWKLVRIMEMQKTFISLAKNWDQHPWNTVA